LSPSALHASGVFSRGIREQEQDIRSDQLDKARLDVIGRSSVGKITLNNPNSMKNTLITAFILVVFQLPTFGVTPTPIPIVGDQLQNDVDANGHNITNLGVSAIGHAKDIWIAVRTDEAAGSGAEIDPLNCGGTSVSAQADRLDAILTTYQPNYTIHWAPGTNGGPALRRRQRHRRRRRLRP
jgi:hypothetical protein